MAAKGLKTVDDEPEDIIENEAIKHGLAARDNSHIVVCGEKRIAES